MLARKFFCFWFESRNTHCWQNSWLRPHSPPVNAGISYRPRKCYTTPYSYVSADIMPNIKQFFEEMNNQRARHNGTVTNNSVDIFRHFKTHYFQQAFQSDSINQSVNQFLKCPKWHSHCKDHWLGDVSKLTPSFLPFRFGLCWPLCVFMNYTYLLTSRKYVNAIISVASARSALQFQSIKIDMWWQPGGRFRQSHILEISYGEIS